MSATNLKHIALGDLEHELATTRRLLERVPDEHLDWRPHERSMSLGELATHVANLVRWQVGMVQLDEYDFATAPLPMKAAENRDALLRTFDRNVEALRAALEEVDDEALRQPWTLRSGEQVLQQRPRAAMLRGLGISHIVHHRGQLSVYLRLLDVPLPPIYGPTADERPTF